jgi:transcriptional regulator with XRE-family HTH domain
LGISAAELTGMCGVNLRTLLTLESGAHTNPTVKTLNAIKSALEAAGVEFLGDHGVSLREKP